jgi:hypothetical protein
MHFTLLLHGTASMTAPATPYLTCPRCGTQNRSDQATCYACKQTLAGLYGAETTSADLPPAAAYQVACPDCQRRVRLTADIYRRVKAGETGVRCSRCAAPLDVSGARPEQAGAAAPVSAPPTEHSGLHSLGWLLVVIGALGLLVGFFMETSVASTSSYGSYGLDRVHNIGLIARQVVVTIASGLTLVAGAIFVAAAYLSDLRTAAWKQ